MARISAAQLVERKLDAIGRRNADLRALVHVDPAEVRRQAAAADGGLRQGPLFGETFVVKDLIDVAGQPTAAGSRLFGTAPVAADAACVARLKSAGAVLIGRANMHELAAGEARNPWLGQVVNPLSDAHGTGGTSSGSAAAVAAGFCSFALGTDSGGSNRSTAAATGLYGFKPTNGAIPLDGVRPLAPTLDTVGVIASSPTLIVRCFAALTGVRRDREPVPLAGRTFARPAGLCTSAIDPSVSDALAFAERTIRDEGGRIVDITIEDAPALARAGLCILRYEFAQIYRDRIARAPGDVGPSIHRFLAGASAVSEGEYQDALAVRSAHQHRWNALLGEVDGLMAPVSPGLAPRLSDEHTLVGGDWVPYGAAGAEFRMWANTVGIPAIAIPIKLGHGLPASIQLAGAAHSDEFLLDLAAALGLATRKTLAAQSNPDTPGELI